MRFAIFGFILSGFAASALVSFGCSSDPEVPVEEEDFDATSPESDGAIPGTDGGITVTSDPACTSSVGLPMTGLSASDAGANFVCCGGKLTDLGGDENCGGCGVSCNFGGGGLKCQTITGTTTGRIHSYCAGCLTKAGGNQTTANTYCKTGLCSATGEPTGRCSPSNGQGDCLEEFCSSISAICGRDATGKAITDPNYFCEYR